MVHLIPSTVVSFFNIRIPASLSICFDFAIFVALCDFFSLLMIYSIPIIFVTIFRKFFEEVCKNWWRQAVKSTDFSRDTTRDQVAMLYVATEVGGGLVLL